MLSSIKVPGVIKNNWQKAAVAIGVYTLYTVHPLLAVGAVGAALIKVERDRRRRLLPPPDSTPK